jgi:hypothetical protein
LKKAKIVHRKAAENAKIYVFLFAGERPAKRNCSAVSLQRE